MNFIMKPKRSIRIESSPISSLFNHL